MRIFRAARLSPSLRYTEASCNTVKSTVLRLLADDRAEQRSGPVIEANLVAASSSAEPLSRKSRRRTHPRLVPYSATLGRVHPGGPTNESLTDKAGYLSIWHVKCPIYPDEGCKHRIAALSSHDEYLGGS
jgi:hypothetical protein